MCCCDGRDDMRIVYLNGTQQLIAQPASAAERIISCRRGCWTASSRPLSRLAPMKMPSTCRSMPRLTRSSTILSANCRRALLVSHSREAIMNRIALVVSDVDGTLVTHDKRLTDGARRAVQRLQRCRHRFHHHQQPAAGRHAVSDRAARDHAADRTVQRQFDRRYQAEADRTASDPRRGGSTQHRSARRIRRRRLAVHQRAVDHSPRRRQIRAARTQHHSVRSDLRRGFFALFVERLQDRRRQCRSRRCCNAARSRCSRRWARRQPRSGRRATISTSRRPVRTRAPLSRRWPSDWGFQPTRLPPSATCRTIWRCSRRAAFPSRWATRPTTSRSRRRMSRAPTRKKGFAGAIEFILKQTPTSS